MGGKVLNVAGAEVSVDIVVGDLFEVIDSSGDGLAEQDEDGIRYTFEVIAVGDSKTLKLVLKPKVFLPGIRSRRYLEKRLPPRQD